MSTSIADERRLLAADEYEPVARSHYPALAGLEREELVELVRWLRDQRGKFRGPRLELRKQFSDVPGSCIKQFALDYLAWHGTATATHRAL